MRVPPGRQRETSSRLAQTVVLRVEDPLQTHSVALGTIRTLQEEKRPWPRNWKKISFLSSTWERMPGCSWIGEVENRIEQNARDWSTR